MPDGRHQLLLPKAPKRRHSSRVHDGQVSVPMSNMRWCSDGFEISCENKEKVRVAFALDAHQNHIWQLFLCHYNSSFTVIGSHYDMAVLFQHAGELVGLGW